MITCLERCRAQSLVVSVKEDLGVRMEVAGFENMKVFKTKCGINDWIRKAPTNKVNVLATYTALLDLRKDFAKE